MFGNWIQNKTTENNNEQEERICGICEKNSPNPVTNRCFTCAIDLCEEHKALHSKFPLFTFHKVHSFKLSTNSEKNTSICNEHNQEFVRYCNNCCVLVCQHCIAHQGHEILSIRSAADEGRPLIYQWINQAQMNIKKEKPVENVEQILSINLENAKQEIKYYFENIYSLLKEQERKIDQKAELISNYKISEWKNIKLKQTQKEQILNSAKLAAEEYSDLEFIDKFQQLYQDLRALSISSQFFQIHFDPRIMTEITVMIEMINKQLMSRVEPWQNIINGKQKLLFHRFQRRGWGGNQSDVFHNPNQSPNFRDWRGFDSHPQLNNDNWGGFGSSPSQLNNDNWCGFGSSPSQSNNNSDNWDEFGSSSPQSNNNVFGSPSPQPNNNSFSFGSSSNPQPNNSGFGSPSPQLNNNSFSFGSSSNPQPNNSKTIFGSSSPQPNNNSFSFGSSSPQSNNSGFGSSSPQSTSQTDKC